MWTQEQIDADAKLLAAARINAMKASYRNSRVWQLDQYAVRIEASSNVDWRQMTQAELVAAVESARTNCREPIIREMLNTMLLVEQDTLRQAMTIAELEQALEGDAA